MKFLQLNINSLNTSVGELWDHQKENNYEGIFLQETNYIAEKILGKFKLWKTKIHTIYRNKNGSFGVGTLIPTSVKNVFRGDLKNDNLELESVWSEMKIEGKVFLIGNIYIAPGNENQLHRIDNKLEQHKDKSILLDATYTFKRRDNSGKSTIDLTLTRGPKNVKVKTKEIEAIKTEHQAIEINIEGKDETVISNPKFKTKNAN